MHVANVDGVAGRRQMRRGVVQLKFFFHCDANEQVLAQSALQLIYKRLVTTLMVGATHSCWLPWLLSQEGISTTYSHRFYMASFLPKFYSSVVTRGVNDVSSKDELSR